MKIQADIQDNVNTTILKKTTMTAKTDKLINLVFSELYSNPIKTASKEYIANAIDASIDANVINEKPIQITLPTKLEPYLVIRDFAKGMSDEFFQESFMQAGFSTSDQDNTKNGGFGIGSKSWFSTGNDEIRYTVIFKGKKTSYILSKKNGKYDAYQLPNPNKSTNEPDGVEVKLTCKVNQIKEICSAVYDNVFYIKNVVLVDGVKAPNYSDTLVFENEDFLLFEKQPKQSNSALMVKIGNFVYPIPKTEFKSKYEDDGVSRRYGDHDNPLIKNESYYRNELVFKKDIGTLKIAPNRESIVLNDDLKEFRLSLPKIIKENQRSIDKAFSDYILKKFKDEK